MILMILTIIYRVQHPMNSSKHCTIQNTTISTLLHVHIQNNFISCLHSCTVHIIHGNNVHISYRQISALLCKSLFIKMSLYFCFKIYSSWSCCLWWRANRTVTICLHSRLYVLTESEIRRIQIMMRLVMMISDL